MAKVYFYQIKKQSPQVLYKAGQKIFKVFADYFGKADNVAIKLHFGERKSNTFLGPDFTRVIYEELKNKVKKASLVDCTVLYKGERSFASSHIKLAKDHGFDFAPIDILDGENGHQETVIIINQKHFKYAKIGGGIKKYNAILVISHFKGHGGSGFGGALKNIGMGLGSKGGKLAMHQAFKIAVDPKLCQGCGSCVKKCPGKAICLEAKKAKIDYQKCLGCGLCISVCPIGAVVIPWESGSSRELQERMVEYALAVLKNRKAFFINALINITASCDCMDILQKPILKDIGILASDDIVALENASLDLAGRKNFRGHGNNPDIQINYAQKLGLGKKKYKLVKLN